jgi:hypothetical protein
MAQRIAFKVSREDKLSITALTHDMVRGSQGINARFAWICEDKMQNLATDQQIATFAKLYKLGWDIIRVVTSRAQDKVAFGVALDNCVAWVKPDGVLERSPLGRKGATLSGDWADEVSA